MTENPPVFPVDLSPIAQGRMRNALANITHDPRAWYQGDWVCETTGCLAANIVTDGLGFPAPQILLRLQKTECDRCGDGVIGHLALDMLGLVQPDQCPERLPSDHPVWRFYEGVFLLTSLGDEHSSALSGEHGPDYAIQCFEKLLEGIEATTGIDYANKINYRENIIRAYENYQRKKEEQ